MNVFIKNFKDFRDYHDQWGYCMGWAFSLCDYLTNMGDCPDYWEFKQSPIGPDLSDFKYQIIYELNYEKYRFGEMIEFSRFLYKLRGFLKLAGKDY